MKRTASAKASPSPHLFPQIIRNARTRAGLSQKELGERCDVPQSAVATWESGRRPIQESTIEKVAKALEMTVAELLRGELTSLAMKAERS